ncbi:hypothetical protein B0T25DRAFT_530457 [Lasiosphaeria hispida]|uniref:Cupin type-2 domain-containing protein n=1 Tax=Lasiosphaeria hispida TaxID=260671 RepID=A0AAJ0HXB1_9PEZI|nr:hypothetical protein B0T25DRAFT_530457 [Lasiosphaeria hispida]
MPPPNPTTKEAPQHTSPLGTPIRHITTHDPSTGLGTFSTVLPPQLPTFSLSPTLLGFDGYRTLSQPITMTDDEDLAAVGAAPPADIWFPTAGESLVRYCDWGPGAEVPMHRSETVDFGVLLCGEMELTLDGGEARVIRAGELIVQRGTLHAWRNPSETVWARGLFFLLGANPVRVRGVLKGSEMPWEGNA